MVFLDFTIPLRPLLYHAVPFDPVLAPLVFVGDIKATKGENPSLFAQ